MRATFDADHLLELLALSETARTRRPTYAQLFDPTLWRADLEAAGRAAAMEGLRTDVCPNPTIDDLDCTRIPPGLMLAGDEGIYFMTNAVSPEMEALRARGRHVAYAREADPTWMPCKDVRHAQHTIFGREDGVEFLGAEQLQRGLVPGSLYEIHITAKAIVLPSLKGAFKGALCPDRHPGTAIRDTRR
ncbi:DUF3085 domain-containing protein [Limimaricola sp. G21655-S1]|uniref:DUF3085 domain-containing protein n=1 Tax=Limimaricola sp. G21655-S1 TaxID=3014768 RepID=UPI0022AED0F7|nr:DUF3085 domain-containing protein [Limimaricola sp. G21655-S1]MCZ4261548.1 DUF3085 domain-containing protein [Limimaricola sp. G21655-S1]